MNQYNDTLLNLIKGQECEREAVRVKPGEYDELYIQAYLDDPGAGKTAALRATGHPNPSRARAWQMHDRLADEIDKRLDKLIQEDAALGRHTLRTLAKTAKSEQVRALCAGKMMDYAGKQKPERHLVEYRDITEIDAEIEQVQKRLIEMQPVH